jgi:CubicO group peptidase (beta-lactamase class C family)
MISLVLAAALQAAPLMAGPVVQPPKGFDAHVEQLRQKVGAPGLSIVMVDEGQTCWPRAMGCESWEAPKR